MTHDMREDIRHYLESMSDDFKVGGLLNKKKKKQEEQEHVYRMLFQNFKTKLINKFDNHCERTCHFNAFY